MKLTYYASKDCMFRWKIEGVAAVGGVECVRKDVDECDKSQLLIKRYPALKTQHGIISGSNAAVRYIARGFAGTGLYGSTLQNAADIDSIIDIIYSDFETPVLSYYQNKESLEKFLVSTDLKSCLTKFDEILKKSTFVVAERLTAADIVLIGAITAAMEEQLLTSPDLSEFANVNRLFNHVSAVIGWNGFAAVSEKEAVAAVSEKEAVAAVSEKEAVDVVSEKAVDAEDPASLSDLDMDGWKRQYSNTTDLLGVAIPYLWEKVNLDTNMFVHMKYQRYDANENTDLIKATNLLAMFLQRFDNSLRKNMFGVCNIFKERCFFGIEGLFLIKGNAIPKALKIHDQFESFSWTVLKPKENPEDKKLITDFFCESDKINGKEIADCKVFK